MPFDAVPVVRDRKRLVALDDTLLKFGVADQQVLKTGTRDIPPWHSSQMPST